MYLTIQKENEKEDPLFEAMNEWNRIGKNVSDAEVERAKSKLKAQLLMQLDGTVSICEDIGRQVLNYGRRLPLAELFERINRITVKDVMRVMSQHCEDADPAIVAIGPTDSFPGNSYNPSLSLLPSSSLITNIELVVTITIPININIPLH